MSTTQRLRPAATPIAWEIVKGETFDIHVPVLDADEAPVTVTGWAAKAQIRRSELDPVLHEWSTTAGNASCTGAEVVLHVVGAVTSPWTFDLASVSVEVYEPGTSIPHDLAVGSVRALPEFTQ